MAQREEFIRRFYGKSRHQQEEAIQSLLSYSMNTVDQPSRFRGPAERTDNFEIIGDIPEASIGFEDDLHLIEGDTDDPNDTSPNLDLNQTGNE